MSDHKILRSSTTFEPNPMVQEAWDSLRRSLLYYPAQSVTALDDYEEKYHSYQPADKRMVQNEDVEHSDEKDDEDETGVDPMHIEWVMTQVKVSRSGAVRALKAADGDIVDAIIKIMDEHDKKHVTPGIQKEMNVPSSSILDTFPYRFESSVSSVKLGGSITKLYGKDILKNELDGDYLDSSGRGRRTRRAGSRRTRAKLAIREQRHSVQPTPLLPGLKNHPSIYIRLGQRPTERNFATQNNWTRAFEVCSNAAGIYKELLYEAGFGDFLSIKPFKISSGGYMSALVERYFSETHTLHLGTFEIGPTPLAWTMITGIRFGGNPLSPPNITPKECANLLGLEGTTGVIYKDKIKLEVLCPSTLDFSKEPTINDLEWMFRRLILYLVGSSFFSGTDSMVSIRMVSALSNIRKINQYDWGAATFSAFLRGMRQRTSECSGAFSGFYPFLLLWAYEHIPYMRPSTRWSACVFPRACRWNLMDVPITNEFTWYRLELEYLEEDEVDFDPYKELWEKEDFQHERALSQKRIAFMGSESWEVYMGERNLRQFGGRIQIPHSPPTERFGEKLRILTISAKYLLQGVDAWDLLEDEECDYSEWFHANSLGRILSLDQFQGRTVLGGRLLELWLKVHRDGHKVITPHSLQKLEDTATKWKQKCENTEAKLDYWKGVAMSRSSDINFWQRQASNAEAKPKKWLYLACCIITFYGFLLLLKNYTQ